MPDIIVTTPKSQTEAAAQEAADAIAHGGGEYFRRFPYSAAPKIQRGERVYYVEAGFLVGFAVVSRVEKCPTFRRCQTTGRVWGDGFYVYMDAASWTWIVPVPMRGFQGFRYADIWQDTGNPADRAIRIDGVTHGISNAGGWRDPRPEIPDSKDA